MWARVVASDWLFEVLTHCRGFDNTYLFQTKNPERFRFHTFPRGAILGTTIETNRGLYQYISQAPDTVFRYRAMASLPSPKMVSVEPIMDFDLDVMVDWINRIEPQFVSIGADSKGHHLPEPPPDKVDKLIEELSKFTEVKIKPNLKRIKREILVEGKV